MFRSIGHGIWLLFVALALVSCSEPEDEVDDGGAPRPAIPVRDWACVDAPEPIEAIPEIGCRSDFDAVAAAPLDASIPGARSGKVIIDRFFDNEVHFQNSTTFPTHYDYASEHLSGGQYPLVPLLPEFNQTEYSSPTRRFLLGAVTYFEGPDLFVYEIAPYDGATAEMIVDAFSQIELATYFGAEMRFYANSATVEETVRPVRNRLDVITTDELFEGIDYQPLNVAESYGRLTFVTAEELETEYVSFRDIVVLDRVPNDISVVAGIITEEFQTALSHINVLSRNRGTPNMALRGAFNASNLRDLEGQWVRLEVTATDYVIGPASVEDADAWWEANRPAAVQVPGLDQSVRGLPNVEDAVDADTDDLNAAIKVATRAVGGKAAHYGVLRSMDGMPTPPGFVVPVYYYQRFMRENGFSARVEELLADDEFNSEPRVRDAALKQLRSDMMNTPIDPQLLGNVKQKMLAEYPGTRMRFRSSTNAEDLDGFTGAGLYTSVSAEADDPERPVGVAMRSVWASVWNFRAFEERSYRSIDHLSVAMALLVHRSFPDEEVNGVALTNNPFDPSGLEPAYYINAQCDDVSVVQPPPGVTTESVLYYFERANQPATYLSRSSLVEPEDGETVLTTAQLYELGTALAAINRKFAPAYSNGQAWWAMDVEFKFDGEPGETPKLFVKQARPFL